MEGVIFKWSENLKLAKKFPQFFGYLSASSLLFFVQISGVSASEIIGEKLELSESKKESGDSVFNFDIYSLTRKKENSFDAASATYVLKSEDIRRSGATSIPEALRLIPGMQVSRIDGNKWAIAIRGFSHQFSNKLLVMIDGRTVYNPLFSGVAWDIHDYVLEDIEKIEVIRGPGGTIWGANAVNGIINIITKAAVKTQGGYISQVFGNSDKSISEVRYGGKVGEEDYYRVYAKNSVRGGAYNKNGSYRGDENRQVRGGFRYDINSVSNSKISLIGDIFDGRANDYFTTLKGTPRNNKDSTGGNLNMSWDKTLSKDSKFSLNTYYDYDSFTIPVLSRSAETIDIDFQHFYRVSEQNNLTWGVGYRQISDKINDAEAISINGGQKFTPIKYTPSHRNDEIYSIFLQDKIGLIADKLYLTLGSKFLHNDYTGFESQPNARLSFYPSRNQTMWFSVSKAIRMPTRAEISFDIKEENDATTVSLKNTNAHSEKLVAYELGYRIKPSTKTLFDVTAFYNDYSSLRTYENINNIPTVGNLGEGQSYGGEVLMKWQVKPNWRLEASYDFLKVDLGLKPYSTDNSSILSSSDGLNLVEGRSPKNQFRLRSYFNLTPKIEFDNLLYYVDSMPMAKLYTTDPQGTPAYIRYDFRIGYLPTRNLDLSFGIRDLFDKRHREYYSALFNTNAEIGRTYFIKAAWQY